MKNKSGFTLIEVLIALAILAIALAAVLRTTSQNIRDTAYLQNKIIANWVATEVMNKIRLGLLKVPSGDEGLTESIDVLNHTWEWEATMNESPNPKIKKIEVKVSPFIDLVSYIYAP